MPKNMTYFALLANQSNALKSTGPRTDAGKAVSKMNAVKHGCRATETLIDENHEEVRAARERWVQDAKPQGTIATAVVDLSFRLYRQIDRAIAIDDAAINLRVEEARDTVLTERTQFIRGAISLFETDPFEGYPRLRVTADGVEILLLKCDQLDGCLGLGSFNMLDATQLSAMEGLPEPDELLSGIVGLFDHHTTAARLIQRHQGATEGADRLDYERAVIEYKKTSTEIDRNTQMVLARVESVRQRFQEERITAQVEEAVLIRRTIDLAKFDDSHEGKLRRRYITDAQRDFFRAYRELMKLCKPAGAKQEIAKPTDVPQSSQGSRTGSPIEATPDYDDEGEDAESSATPTNVRERRTA